MITIKKIATGILADYGDGKVLAYHDNEKVNEMTKLGEDIYKHFQIKGLKVVDEKEAAKIKVHGEKA